MKGGGIIQRDAFMGVLRRYDMYGETGFRASQIDLSRNHSETRYIFYMVLVGLTLSGSSPLRSAF